MPRVRQAVREGRTVVGDAGEVPRLRSVRRTSTRCAGRSRPGRHAEVLQMIIKYLCDRCRFEIGPGDLSQGAPKFVINAGFVDIRTSDNDRALCGPCWEHWR